MFFVYIYVPCSLLTSVPTAMATPALSPDEEQSQLNNADFKILLPKDFGFILVPRHLRYDPSKPFHFGILLNIAFGLASTFSECFLPPFEHLIG